MFAVFVIIKKYIYLWNYYCMLYLNISIIGLYK